MGHLPISLRRWRPRTILVRGCRGGALHPPGVVPMRLALAVFLLSVVVSSRTASGQHRLALQGNDRLAIVDQSGTVEWEMRWGGIHDIHVLANGNIMVQDGAAKVVESDRKSKE